jgi:hypothetical protein
MGQEQHSFVLVARLREHSSTIIELKKNGRQKNNKKN